MVLDFSSKYEAISVFNGFKLLSRQVYKYSLMHCGAIEDSIFEGTSFKIL